MIQRQFFRLSSAFVLVSLLNCAQAAELGDLLVRSHLGQPLSADIELTGLAADNATVQVALSDPEVYRGANIAMHPALAAVNITLIARDGKRYVHLASPKSVESEYVHIFLDLTENGRRAVRQVTLWLSPDPNPAPPPSKAVAPAPLAAIAPSLPAPAPAAPSKAPVLAASPVAVLKAPVVRAQTAAQPAACAPTFTAAQIGACTALDGKNAALAARIVELEGKVRALAAVHGKVEPAPAKIEKRLLPKAPATKLVPMGAAPARETGPMPWLFIAIAGAIMLALAALLAFLLRRKRQDKRHDKRAETTAGFIASVKNRLMPARKEPTLEPEAAAS
jgi:pilus assembly protein FimV